MRSIERVYKRIAERNQNLGAYPCLAQAVAGRGFSRKAIVKAFKTVMPDDEYDETETKALIDYLEHITNGLEEGEFHSKTPHQGV